MTRLLRSHRRLDPLKTVLCHPDASIVRFGTLFVFTSRSHPLVLRLGRVWFPRHVSAHPGLCSGDARGVQIVDKVIVPTGLPAGDYVLGWRWDCEETAQIWSTCSDITIEAAP